MSRTIMELFHSSGLKESVKADKETFIEQETSGIRIKSLVDVNNPLIYGNEATRIALRTTPTLDAIKKNTTDVEGGGGLIGGAITGARNFVNDKLGIPSALTPSKVSDKIIELRADKKSKTNSQTPITQDSYGPNGSLVGKFLKDTGGGNPTTIGKQALGKGIGLLKDKAREGLFGGPQSIGEAAGDDNAEKIKEYSNVNPYTKILKDVRDYKNEGGYQDFESYNNQSPIKFANASDSQIDLRDVSPAYAIARGNLGRFGNSEYAFEAKNIQEAKKIRYQYSSEEPYANVYKNGERGGVVKGSIAEANSLENLYGLTNSDNINTVSVGDAFDLDETDSFIKTDDKTYADLIPLWFRRKGGTKPIVFRAIVSGITETTSPSWSGQKFLGNPYQFYLYEGIERSLSFNVKVAAASPVELATIWERLKVLTSYTYPTIRNGLSDPPIIEFRLGSMYSNRTSFIDSLTYTIPDEGVWETEGSIGYLPKFVDIAISMKFIEQEGDEQQLYDFNLSKAAVKKINEQREAANFSTNERVNSNGVGTAKPIKIPKLTIRKQSVAKLELGGLLKPHVPSINPNIPPTIPPSSDTATEDIKTEGAQSSVVDSLEGKTPVQAKKELEKKAGISLAQAEYITNRKANYAGSGVKVEQLKYNQLPPMAKDEASSQRGNIFVKTEGPHTVSGINTYVYHEVSVWGTPYELMHGSGEEPIEKTPRQIELSRAMDEAIGVSRKKKKRPWEK